MRFGPRAAAVVDLDRRALVLFGGEGILCDVPLRRAYLDLLRHPWRGWRIQWAHEGLAEIADYVGRPRSGVLVADDPRTRAETELSLLKPPEERSCVDIVGSVTAEND